MPIQLLRELLGLDTINDTINDKKLNLTNDKDTIDKNTIDKNTIDKDKNTIDTKDKRDTRGRPDTSDISSNLFKTIVKAHKPVNIDLDFTSEFISDYDTDSDASYDSFFDQGKN